MGVYYAPTGHIWKEAYKVPTIESQYALETMDLAARHQPSIMYLLSDNTRLVHQRFPRLIDASDIVQQNEEGLEFYGFCFDFCDAVAQPVFTIGASSDIAKFNQVLRSDTQLYALEVQFGDSM